MLEAGLSPCFRCERKLNDRTCERNCNDLKEYKNKRQKLMMKRYEEKSCTSESVIRSIRKANHKACNNYV